MWDVDEGVVGGDAAYICEEDVGGGCVRENEGAKEEEGVELSVAGAEEENCGFD